MKIFLMSFTALLAFLVSGCQVQKENTVPVIIEKDGITIEVLKQGEGAGAQKNDNLSMHYVGTLENGDVFDSSRDRGQPFNFTLGAGQVITGWDIGLEEIKVGELRRLIIPANHAYGQNSVGSIPANSTLIFEVELMKNSKQTF